MSIFNPIAVFSHGRPIMADYTPGSNVGAGDVIVDGITLRIAHCDIPANTLGAVALGGGVYNVPKTAGASTAIGDGLKVYWDATNKVITTNAASGANLAFGDTVLPSVDADTTQRVLHKAN